MTLSIDLTPTEERRLAAVAHREGLAPTEVARKLLTANLPPIMGRERETRLVEEYHSLLDREEDGSLSAAQAARLHQVEAELDFLEAQNPVEQDADRRLGETSDKLDEILALLRSLPRKDALP